MRRSAKLSAVGVGPGDPELITLKGLRVIQAAQLIFVPRSKSGEQSLALRIAEPWLDTERQQLVELPLPMTRDSGQLVPAWQAAAELIADSFDRLSTIRQASPQLPARSAPGDSVSELRGVYLLLGDPLLYGTFTYIWAELAERHRHIDVEIVPGVTSFAAGAARAKFVLSTTSDRLAILPASYETDAAQLRRLLSDFDTVILMKVGGVLPQILTALQQLDLVESTLYVERVGMPEERILMGRELYDMQNQRRPYLSLLIVRRRRDDGTVLPG